MRRNRQRKTPSGYEEKWSLWDRSFLWHHQRACRESKKRIWHRRCKSIWRLSGAYQRGPGCCICNHTEPLPCRDLYRSHGSRKRCYVWETDGKELCRSTEDGGDFRENRQNPEHRIPEPLPSRFAVSERNVQGWRTGRDLLCKSPCT